MTLPRAFWHWTSPPPNNERSIRSPPETGKKLPRRIYQATWDTLLTGTPIALPSSNEGTRRDDCLR